MLSHIPHDHKVAYYVETPTGMMFEIIPEGEALDNWTEMLTVQVFRNSNGYTLDSFRAGMAAAWAEMYPGGATRILERGTDPSAPTLYWSQTCPMTGEGLGENAWFKARLQGEHITVVQKAFRFDPPEAAVAYWLDFMRRLHVDFRSATRH